MKSVLIVALLLVGGAIGGRLRRLAGSEPVRIENVPYYVSLRVDNFHICGGALISSRHVVTAAHCVANLFDEPYEELTVVTGADQLSTGGTSRGVERIDWHEHFENSLETLWKHDIAVLTLRTDVDINEKQTPVDLPKSDPKVNGTGIVCGFGRTEFVNPYLANSLRSFKTTVLPSAPCQRLMEKHKILDGQVCAVQKKGIGLCKGDSGGPLVQDGKLVGIASWNILCAAGFPDVYTNVYKYVDFIRKKAEIALLIADGA